MRTFSMESEKGGGSLSSREKLGREKPRFYES